MDGLQVEYKKERGFVSSCSREFKDSLYSQRPGRRLTAERLAIDRRLTSPPWAHRSHQLLLQRPSVRCCLYRRCRVAASSWRTAVGGCGESWKDRSLVSLRLILQNRLCRHCHAELVVDLSFDEFPFARVALRGRSG